MSLKTLGACCWSRLAGMVLVLVTAACTCGTLGSSFMGPTPTLFVLPTVPATETVVVTEQPPTEDRSSSVEPLDSVSLDVCSLATVEEVGVILGGPVVAEPRELLGDCVYALDTTDIFERDDVAIKARCGDMAKVSAFAELAVPAVIVDDLETDPFEELVPQANELTLQEVVEQLIVIAQAGDTEYTPIVDLGDVAYRVNDPYVPRIIVVSDGVYLSFQWIGGDADTIADRLVVLVPTILERIPPEFYACPEEEDTSVGGAGE